MRASKKIKEKPLEIIVREECPLYRNRLPINYQKTCHCAPTHIHCMTPKEWLKSQLGVWQFFYEARDIRNKNLHPATFPIALAKKGIELFTHKGQMVFDLFVASRTTLLLSRMMIYIDGWQYGNNDETSCH
jgi:DNA modification methylase